MDITKPILATDFDETKLDFTNGYIVQPKIDGVRGLHLYGRSQLTGRSLKPFGNKLVPLLFPNIVGIDGELTYGPTTAPDLCRTTTSVVSTHNDDRAHSLVLNAFDYVTPATVSLGYFARYETLQKLLLTTYNTNVRLVPYQLVRSIEELYKYEAYCLEKGYEGVILRSPGGVYKNGRTTTREGTYLRIKRFTQEDAIVISLVEAMENTNEAVTNALGRSERPTSQDGLVPKGMVGSLICRDIKTRQKITLGPGKMTHIERFNYWSTPDTIVGKTVSYKSFPHGVKTLPRFPTFESIRIEEDIVND
jgi:DNA ligase-1